MNKNAIFCRVAPGLWESFQWIFQHIILIMAPYIQGEEGGVWGGFIGSCLSRLKTPPIIKPHAVCVEVPTFDLQDLLKNIVKKKIKKEARCAIYTCNLMLYLLMGAPVIYVCSRLPLLPVVLMP